MWLFTIFLTEFSPNPVTPQMEWVELYNDSENNIDVSGYSIRDSTNYLTSSHRQILSGTTPPQSYFVASLDNPFINKTSNDTVNIYDKNNNLIDSQSSKSIPVGLSFSRQTNGTWCPTDPSPNLPNNLCKESYSLQNSPTAIPYISLKITNLDADKELIEITNDNNFTVSLFDWRVRDNSGSVRKLSCQNINANSSCQSAFTSGYLNNDTDKLTLLDPLKREISVYSYENLKQTVTKPTTTPKLTVTPKNSSLSPLSRGDVLVPTKTEGFVRQSTVTINQSSPIHNLLSIILMLIGSVFILFPLIFHAKFNKK
ncbi:hypothetical protein AUK05_03500 [Candidatus Shapirobacteria bacterium CG2_30_35_20]|uniref:LTD domain-containing protein n=4 Tax=Candidatus Shapironibacteriota TaxID=1752721 RepID=A0A1J5I0B7_9BACT|nr:MAG: hypothetical protein AUK05_03500 [Candidatus Shapirobacteria bacterium CG2_30_35_20]PIV07845.1 MAG: hypothetical protein COS53_00240 [Candidatus Shapirobacteria bacterium CG03_land_8_20_14_0_80_35_14]